MNMDVPWGGFDLETTAPDPETALMVQACVGIGWSSGVWVPQVWMLNPGAPIPPETTEIHGITDEMVADCPSAGKKAPQIAGQLLEIWRRGGAVCGHNVVYDFTVLDRALRRRGSEFKVAGPVVDTLVLDRLCDRYRSGSRRLPDVTFLFGVQETPAHRAEADTLASVRLAWKLVRYGLVALPSRRDLVPIRELSWQELHDLQVRAYDDQQRDLFRHFAKVGKVPTSTNTDWPIRPYKETS